jgi:hypothetical protein
MISVDETDYCIQISFKITKFNAELEENMDFKIIYIAYVCFPFSLSVVFFGGGRKIE